MNLFIRSCARDLPQDERIFKGALWTKCTPSAGVDKPYLPKFTKRPPLCVAARGQLPAPLPHLYRVPVGWRLEVLPMVSDKC